MGLETQKMFSFDFVAPPHETIAGVFSHDDVYLDARFLYFVRTND